MRFQEDILWSPHQKWFSIVHWEAATVLKNLLKASNVGLICYIKMSSSHLLVRKLLWDNWLQPLLENRTVSFFCFPNLAGVLLLAYLKLFKGFWEMQSLTWSMYEITKEVVAVLWREQSSIVPCFKLISQSTYFFTLPILNIQIKTF